MCNHQEQLVGYIYGELSPFEKAAFEAHLRDCADCRAEVGELGRAREHLTAWAPPTPDFGYQIVHNTTEPSPAPKPALWSVPRWAMAAAAALILMAGAAGVANLELRYGADGSVVVRTGWGAAPGSGVQTAALPSGGASQGAAGASAEQLQRQLVALERRLDELQASQPAQIVKAGADKGSVSVPELRRILAESEARQRAEMDSYVGQIWKDFNAVRANDLVRVQQTLDQAQGLTNMQLRQQRDTLDSLRYLHAVSTQQK
jgi:hypothetical protein